MGKRGPCKTPTALAKLRGYPGKQKKHREPEPAAPPPHSLEPPPWLAKAAQKEWRRLEPQLTRLGMLTVLDLSKFAAYCGFYARWCDYQTRLDRLRKAGRDFTTTKSGTIKAHPLVGMAKGAAEMMNRFGSQFGLSASDRASLSLPLDPTAPKHDRPEQPAPAVPRDEFEDFMRKTRGTRGPTR